MAENGTRAGRAFVAFITTRPLLSLLLGGVLLALLVPGIQRLRAEFTYRVWFAEGDPLLETFDDFERRFGNDDSAIVLVHSPSGVFDVESATLLRALTERLWTAPEVIRVDSLANFNWVHDEDGDLVVEPLFPDTGPLDEEILAARKKVALAHELVPGYLVGRAGTTAVIYARLQPRIDGVPDFKRLIDGVQAILDEFRGQGDHSFHITGSPMVAYSFRQAATFDARTLLPIVGGLVIICLTITLRRASAVLLIMLVLVATLAATLGAAGWLDDPINNLTATIPQFLVAIGIATGVHVVKTFDQHFAPGVDRKVAVFRALHDNLLPTFLTSATTSIGFLSFITATVIPVRDLGVISGIGTMIAWLLTYLFVGALLVLLPLSPRTHQRGGWRWGAHIAGVIDRRKNWILLGFGGATAIAIAIAVTLRIDSDYFAYFADDAPINIATQRLETDVGGALAVEIIIESGSKGGVKDPEFLRRVDRFADWLRHHEYITSVVSVVDLLKATNRSLDGDRPESYRLPETREAVAQQYLLYTMSLPQGMDLNDRVSIDESAMRLTSLWRKHNSNTVLPEIDKLRAYAETEGLTVTVTGKNLLLLQMNPDVVDSFVQSVLSSLVTISLLMMLVLRSVRLGLLAMVPNVIPLLFGAALLAALGQSLDIGTIVVFGICLGIAVDDTVHFLTHYGIHRRNGCTPVEAVAENYDRTMPALVATTLILVLAFGAFAISSFVPNRMFGVLVAFVLTVALTTDGFLLPALLMRRDDAKGDPPR